MIFFFLFITKGLLHKQGEEGGKNKHTANVQSVLHTHTHKKKKLLNEAFSSLLNASEDHRVLQPSAQERVVVTWSLVYLRASVGRKTKKMG